MWMTTTTPARRMLRTSESNQALIFATLASAYIAEAIE